MLRLKSRQLYTYKCVCIYNANVYCIKIRLDIIYSWTEMLKIYYNMYKLT